MQTFKEIIVTLLTIFWCVITMAAFVYLLTLAYYPPAELPQVLFAVGVIVFALCNALACFTACRKI